MHHAARAGLHEGFPRAQGVFCSRKVGFLEGCCGGEGGIGEGEKFVNEPFFIQVRHLVIGVSKVCSACWRMLVCTRYFQEHKALLPLAKGGG